MTMSAKVIEKLIEWIDDNIHQPLRIEEIANRSGYSKWYLQRLFVLHTGENLGRYVREKKISHAARDLRETDDLIADISVKYGFESQQTFTRIFTRQFKIPPGAYRKKHIESGNEF